MAPNRDNPNEQITVRISKQIPLDLDQAQFYKYLRDMILERFAHELDEAFNVKGIRIFDPHEPQG